jgi:hypothetical protein
MPYRNWTPWTPGRGDSGQVDEYSRERALFAVLGSPGGRSEEERCQRALRAMELERVATEVRRAAAALVRDELALIAGEAFAVTRHKVLGSELAMAIAALNLMGIDTLLPGEDPFDGPLEMIRATRVYLRQPDSDREQPLTIEDRLDAASGLICDFQRSTIFCNGLRIEPVAPVPAEPLYLLAAHGGIMAAFGEFLARKYIVEGWNLS